MSRPTLNLDEMTRDEKLRLIEEIWESLEDDTDDLPVPDWHRRELDRRLDELDRGEAIGIPWEQALQEIQSRLK
jgi:putative addiction module component (TIGR02574 family)